MRKVALLDPSYKGWGINYVLESHVFGEIKSKQIQTENRQKPRYKGRQNEQYSW